VYILPVIGGFVGGDTVAGMVAIRMWERQGPLVLVDLGTNGEIALRHAGQFHAAATAAGPAFEGARIRHGMRALPGAIERVAFDDGQIRYQVIGGEKPAGICGSGLVDLLAELLRHGLVDSSGRLISPESLSSRVPEALRHRLYLEEGRPAFLVVPATESATGRPIVLTQQDIRQLQLATAAIRAGLRVLCQQVGLPLDQIQEIWIAGGFGYYLRAENAQRIGLLPAEIPTERIHFAGNTSIAGAILAASSLEARQYAAWLAEQTRHVDLATEPTFQQAFIQAMAFPPAEDARVHV
jgi:uncharacterized 2Fe-2S/4Fe-4S cluster protein (DUF4445 family)